VLGKQGDDLQIDSCPVIRHSPDEGSGAATTSCLGGLIVRLINQSLNKAFAARKNKMKINYYAAIVISIGNATFDLLTFYT